MVFGFDSTRDFGGETLVSSDVDQPAERPAARAPAIPAYLQKYYWWAYVHPNAVKVFERPWLIDAILWGNYARLRDAALDALGDRLPGRTIQIACAYGDVSLELAKRVQAGGGALDVVDVVPAQLDNLARKWTKGSSARLLLADSAALPAQDATYDRALLFFLLHEQPEDVRRRTLAEAFRVVKPGGRIVILDYARPHWWHPLRYLFAPVLAWLEPFALDLWRRSVATWLPSPWDRKAPTPRRFFGGLYQLLTIER